MIDVNQFRADLPEFASTATYSSSGITFWLNVAYKMLAADRWGNMLDTGAELYAAHNITIEARAQLESANGGIAGQNTGAISSKSVDKVSASYDTANSSEKDGGHWNLTTYGTRYLRYAKIFGAGAIQIGMGQVPAGSGLGWNGVDTTPNPAN